MGKLWNNMFNDYIYDKNHNIRSNSIQMHWKVFIILETTCVFISTQKITFTICNNWFKENYAYKTFMYQFFFRIFVTKKNNY